MACTHYCHPACSCVKERERKQRERSSESSRIYNETEMQRIAEKFAEDMLSVVKKGIKISMKRKN